MSCIEWKKTELTDGLKPLRGTLTCETHGPDVILCHERVLAVNKWVTSLSAYDRQLVNCLRGKWTLEQAATRLGKKKRTVQRHVQSLREQARHALEGVRP